MLALTKSNLWMCHFWRIRKENYFPYPKRLISVTNFRRPTIIRDVLSNDSLLRVISMRYMEGSSPRLSFKLSIPMNQIILGINAPVYVKYYNGIYRFESLKGAANQSGPNMVLYPILSKKPWRIDPYIIDKDNVRKNSKLHRKQRRERENQNKIK